MKRVVVLFCLYSGSFILQCRPTLTAEKRLPPVKKSRDYLVAHIYVALCDNKYQGIVPVPAFLGNGQEGKENLYWGAGAGIQGWFNNKRAWRRFKITEKPAFPILERIAFEKVLDGRRLIVIADAYDGRNIVNTMADFLTAAAGGNVENVRLKSPKKAGDEPPQIINVQTGGYADLVLYVGHNGLMDNALPPTPARLHTRNPREAVVLACISNKYFEQPLARAGTTPLLLTTGLMAPEAYTVDAVLMGKLRDETPSEIHEGASRAYDTYQKSGLKAARNLFTYPGKPSGKSKKREKT